MNRGVRFVLTATLTAGLVASAVAQGFRVEPSGPPTRSIIDGGSFSSTGGRFSIALPDVMSRYEPISMKSGEGTVTGESYVWNMVEGDFSVAYIDRSDFSNQRETADYFFGKLHEQIAKQAADNGGTVVSNRPLSLGDAVGFEFVVESNEGLTITRAYLVKGRLYQLKAKIATAKRASEPAALKTLDTLRLLSNEGVAEAIRKRVEAATPKPLPQSPTVRRVASDAYDDGLKGKVKVIVEDVEDQSGEWSVQGRKPSSVSYYDVHGYLTKKVSYDYRANPFEIKVYGYIDAKRVSKLNMIHYEYDPPPMMMGPPPAPGTQNKRDDRYSYQYVYSYDRAKRLREMRMFMNDGEPGMRYVYEYSGNEKEELAYTEDGTLNQKYVSVLDSKGNEIEWRVYDVKDGSIRYKYLYTYEFDATGNWLKRSSQKEVVRNGERRLEPGSINYRTITYY